jgi:hypothetical protein
VDAALGDSRSLSRGLSPGPLPPGGLGTALRELARQTRETVEVDCELVGGGAPSAGGADAVQLYRIAQEATQNAVKHAAAGRITIELAEDGAEVRLAVRDDGKGMPAAAPPGLACDPVPAARFCPCRDVEVAAGEGGGPGAPRSSAPASPRPPRGAAAADGAPGKPLQTAPGV